MSGRDVKRCFENSNNSNNSTTTLLQLPGCNSCRTSSEYPGCNDPFCREKICKTLEQNQCCTESWNDECVMLAVSVCNPEVVPKPPGIPCPLGFICDEDEIYMSNCSDVRALPIDLKLGDVFGGVYCMEGRKLMTNCPEGYYCPTPFEKIICPEGSYCSHKSVEPWIECSGCEEGAEELARDIFGYIVFSIGVFVLIVVISVSCIRRYQKDLWDRQTELLARQVDALRLDKRRKEREAQLERLKPKLDIIAKRLVKVEEERKRQQKQKQQQEEQQNSKNDNSVHSSTNKVASDNTISDSSITPGDDNAAHSDTDQHGASNIMNNENDDVDNKNNENTVSSSIVSDSTKGENPPPEKAIDHHDSMMIQLEDDKKLQFNGRRIFDCLDTNNDGVLSYDELNAVLGLDCLELKNFVSRMQELGNANNTTTTYTATNSFMKLLQQQQQQQQTNESQVSRTVFIKYFLQVLEENSHLNLTPEEAAATYDEILLQNKTDKLKEKMLYTSSISRFLSDRQLYTLIKKLREVHSADDENGGVQSTRSSISNRRRRKTSFFKSTKGEAEYDTTIPRDVFVEHYPTFLLQVITSDDSAMPMDSMRPFDSPGVDICFKDLSLSVKGLDRTINVVDHVTGRIRAKTMTALMGGSGAGKTSLLNALCGRAFYGEVHGDIHINGQPKSIEEIKDNVGFVPQDDIVHAELTVRENFIYAGKFRLPKGTSHQMISDLAEETLASLGLSRVADSLVGDVKRRGVSGGEKKRVNIGLELMAKPSCLFLDEPTSGLDASSALLVMSSLRHLVDVQGVTVVSVIHQPRKFIFDLFDSLILLGVGGRMVYHGPTDKAFDYFDRLNYVLPPGESVSDWLIDISSGRLEPEAKISDDSIRENGSKDFVESSRFKIINNATSEEGIEVTGDEKLGKQVEETPLATKEDDHVVVVRKGVSTGKEKDAFEEAKARRAWLYEKWNEYFDNLSEKEKELYNVPGETKLPQSPIKQSFLSQLCSQISREFLISWRNSTSKLIDTLILVGATIVITVTDGLPEMTRSRDPNIKFEDIVSPTEESVTNTFKELFIYSFVPQWQFPLKIGIIVAVLIGLQATRIVTAKRLEFFREASSGYNINSYFVSVHFVSTIEHSLQIVILSFFAAWLRDPIASWWSFFAHFLAMVWICISWALFFSMVVPADNVTVTVGFFMAFCGLMISGAFPPLTWKVIYEEGGFGEHLSGWFSPTRYFFEGLTVGEYRCLPPQSGWTVADESVNFERENTLMRQFGIAGHDPNATQQSCKGWYWGILPSIFVGLTVRYAGWLAMHSLNRGQQTKKSLWFEMQRNKNMIFVIIFLIAILFGLGIITTWLYSRDLEPNYVQNDIQGYTATLEELGGEEYVRGVLESANITNLLILNNNNINNINNINV